MATIGRRVTELERRSSPATHARYHWIIVEHGDNVKTAQAAYQAEKGPIGAQDDWLIWEIIDPTTDVVVH